jgi:exosortase D (VPLPA-CTERM-specific)
MPRETDVTTQAGVETKAAKAQPLGRWLPWLVVAALAAALFLVFDDGLAYVARQWQRDEYSYGYIVPPITAWLVWRRLQTTPAAPAAGGCWSGVALVTVAAALALLARVGGMPSGVFYAFLIALVGLFVAAIGWRRTWTVLPALAYLVFALPLPQTLFIKLSTMLQMVSSQLGVALMRLFGVTVFLEGNVIDLGVYQLQVAEACSGLGYLFPLASFAYLVAYLYRGPLWQKALLLVSAIPITVIINSFRIGIVGVLVDAVGIGAAEGFIHAFEGYVIFFVGAVLFLGEVWVMGRLSGRRGSVLAHLDLGQLLPAKAEADGGGRTPPVAVSVPVLVGLAVLVAGGTAAHALPAPGGRTPERAALVTFPMQIADWRGREQRIAPNFLDILRLDDYVVADYASPAWPQPVNFYVAYYARQDERATIHSPSVCIPAGGWEIAGLTHRRLDSVAADAGGLVVNRAVIAKNLDRQLVYYWFEQRGRQLTDEYTIKAYNILDAVTRGRTDGALVRVTTPMARDEKPEDADRRLTAFLESAYPRLAGYVPQ